MRAMCVALLLAPLVLVNPAWAANWKIHSGKVSTAVITANTEVADAFTSTMPLKAFTGLLETSRTYVDTFPEWIFQNQGAKRLSVEGREEIHMRFHGIWPVSDRDVVLANALSQNEDSGSITLHSVNAENVLGKQDGFVRIPALDNQFIITPMDDGWVRVQFETFVDPGGSVPVWLANLVATKAPLETLQGLKVQLEKPRFANATRKDLPPLPGIDKLSLED